MSDFAYSNSCEKLKLKLTKKLKLTQTDLDEKFRNFREKYIVIFNYTNYYHTKFLSCLGGGGGRGECN